MIGSSAEITPAVDRRILVVDDLPDNCFLLQTVLESEGYEVEVANNGRVALESITSHPPDLVLLDVMMPEMNGFEVTRRLRQNPSLPFIPILPVTGYSEPTLRMDLMLEPMALFVNRLILMTCWTKFGQFYSLET